MDELFRRLNARAGIGEFVLQMRAGRRRVVVRPVANKNCARQTFEGLDEIIDSRLFTSLARKSFVPRHKKQSHEEEHARTITVRAPKA